MKHKNLLVVNHPLIESSLTILRDTTTITDQFRSHAAVVSKLLLIEATKHLKTIDKSIETPLSTYPGKELEHSIVLVPVLRAGLSMLFAAQELLPHAAVGFVGLERDENTAIARSYYQKFPTFFSHSQIFILDPMLATGGSLDDTVTEVLAKGGEHITAVCVVAAPEGVERIEQKYPTLQIVTGALDSHLNEKKYIVPGLGDFGDRYFGTVT